MLFKILLINGIMYYENAVGKLKAYVISLDKDGDKTIVDLTEENAPRGGGQAD
jgi:hypothetical protein